MASAREREQPPHVDALESDWRRPYGTPGWCGRVYPALKRWAKVRCAYGAGFELCSNAELGGGIGYSPVPEGEGPVVGSPRTGGTRQKQIPCGNDN